MIHVNVEETAFVEPDVRITSIFRVHPFTFTEGYRYLTAFIRELNEAVVGVRISDDVPIPAPSNSLLLLLDVLKSWLDGLPPENLDEEGGDPAFRKWHSLLSENSNSLLEDLLRPELYPAIIELSAYLIDSFGRPEEIDYGVGNQVNLVPESYADRAIVEKYTKDYLVFDAVNYIFQIKKGEFHEHSRELWNITAIHTWDRMNKGLLRMYEAEVLQKFSVVKRFRFGALFSFERRDDVPQEGGYATDEDSDLND
ncbi:phosphotyrosyl phosphate activator protein [Teladorsagia circumcincta]|uniref:Serine/threonine-protein phosphatase 2A activator n=1 Tax=Teladorsagia circumcincta TaxID=45464 RepID=A0A2G9UL15_TELCI|nr:phosphotyrosyl phosphate activator protein [Teladorsagia circumcincta]